MRRKCWSKYKLKKGKKALLMKALIVIAGCVFGQGFQETVGSALRLERMAETTLGQGVGNRTESRLKRPSINMVQRTAWYVGAASCPSRKLAAWECWSCQKARETNPSDVYLFSNYRERVEGYILVDNPNKMVVVCFRGTNNLVLGERNAKHPQVLFPDINDPRVRVNKAFNQALDSLTPLFMPYLKSVVKPDYNVMVTGFSLGGAVASLAAVKIHNQLKLPFRQMTLITFGQPRTGNMYFAQAFNAMPMKAARVVNYDDPYPHSPPASVQGYTHHQNELYIDAAQNAHYCSTRVYEDPTCANHISGLDFSPTSHLNAWNVSFNPIYGC